MDEIVALVVKKTGIPAATAKIAVTLVIDYLKKKLPAPVGAQIDVLLRSQGALKTAGSLLGSLTSKAGKKK